MLKKKKLKKEKKLKWLAVKTDEYKHLYKPIWVIIILKICSVISYPERCGINYACECVIKLLQITLQLKENHSFYNGVYSIA